MRPRSYYQGFTRKEFLVGLILGALLIVGLVTYLLPGRSVVRPELVAAHKARHIYNKLAGWAEDHDGEFPTAQKYSNEAFRELFKSGLMDADDEKLFAIHGDAWHKNSASGKGPDGIIGTAPDFSLALQRGECAFAYVSGLDTVSNSALPLFGNAFTEKLGVYAGDKAHKGGIFRGDKGIYVTVGGSAKIGNLSRDLRIMAQRHGNMLDILSKAWGTNPDNIKNPED